MTTLLQKAVTQAQALKPAEQDALAKLMMEEIEGEAKWEAALAKAPEKLTRLAEKAWAEHEAGKTERLNPDHI